MGFLRVMFLQNVSLYNVEESATPTTTLVIVDFALHKQCTQYNRTLKWTHTYRMGTIPR